MSYGNLIPQRELEQETILDKIGRHHLAGTTEKMPDDLKKILSRWDEVLECFASGRMVNYKGTAINQPYNVRDLAKHLMAKFSISQAQAYEDINNARYYHNLAQPREHKEFARGWLADQLKRYIAICEHKGDFKSIVGLTKNLIAIQGLDTQDVEVPDYSKIQPPEIEIVADPREISPNLPEIKDVNKLVQKYLKQKKSDFIDSLIDDAEEVAIDE